MPPHRLDVSNSGNAAETLALRYLEGQGLKLVTRNYRCRQGEIDLVMRDRDNLVFVEVRYRRNPDFGGAVGSVTATKQARLRAAAEHYLLAHPAEARRPCRFDVLGLQSLNDDRPPHWITDAF